MRPRTIFLTGASSGIGRALALEYARRGAHVAIAARRRDVLEDVARAIETAGGKASVVPVDVTSPDAVKESVIASERELGSLDLVIANAGVGRPCHAARLTMESVNEVIDVNIRGAFATILAAVPIMILQGQGQIVGISSLAGRIGLPMSGCYGASKAALSTFLETLRIDLAPSGIRITDVQPGYVATPKTDTYRREGRAGHRDASRARAIGDCVPVATHARDILRAASSVVDLRPRRWQCDRRLGRANKTRAKHGRRDGLRAQDERT
jgi:NAD(P)-dependent dehydrogenase (short-subunit alcohol dehydrogenase family)